MRPSQDSDPHWGPRIDKIPVAGAIGLVITVGIMIGFLAEVPETRLWLFISVPLGILFAVILHFRNS
jgi:hypothetical protein